MVIGKLATDKETDVETGEATGDGTVDAMGFHSAPQGWKKYFIFWDRNEMWKIFCELSTQILYNLN